MPQQEINISNLKPQNTNEEIRDAAFDFAQGIGYMVFATLGFDGNPASRGIEVHFLDDTKTLYIGMSPGKPMYFEMKKHPYVSAVVVQLHGRLSGSVRINAHLQEILPEEAPAIYKRYWELNPGTAALYRKDLGHFRIFKLDRGTGRIFHMELDDVVENHKFTFGGAAEKPWAYEIDAEKCTGCGLCVEPCMEDVIVRTEDGRYAIDHFHCLECGKCADACPAGAVICSGIG